MYINSLMQKVCRVCGLFISYNFVQIEKKHKYFKHFLRK